MFHLETELSRKWQHKSPEAGVYMQACAVMLGHLGDIGHMINDSMREACGRKRGVQR